MQTITTNLLNNMTYISLSIIVAMIVIFIIAVVNNLLLKKSYIKIVRELDAINNDGMEVYNNKMLNEIVSSYKEAYLKSYDGVNTQAIIESKFYKLDKGKIGKESFLNNVITMILTLGIVGTLYNIIVIVTKLTQVFKGVDANQIPSMTSVFGDISTILAYLAIAFVTTFVAIILCFLYSVINSMTHIEMERTNLFSRLEDYLDNSLGANLSKNKPKMLPNEGYANANVLYAIKNTSESMMKTTIQLEKTLSKLSGSLRGMIVEKTGYDEEDYPREDEFEGYEQLRLERLKQIEENKKEIEQRASEKLESMKYADVIPNKDKVYVKEVVVDSKEDLKEDTKEEVEKENKPEINETEEVINEVKDTVADTLIKIENGEAIVNETFDSTPNVETNTVDEPVSTPVIPEYEFMDNTYSTEELKENIKNEERKLENILNEEENMSAVNIATNMNVPKENIKVDVVSEIKTKQEIQALTKEDIEMLKQELIRRQEEEKRIKEIMANSNVKI